MDRIDRYILKHLAGPFFGALLGALALMMLERMLRLLDLVGESEDALGYVFDMLANLVPHYLGLALPAALFIACYAGYRRLADSSELAAFASIGRGLGRLALPAILVAIVLTIVSAYVHSHLQPHGRYAFRTLGFLAANASIAAALESGAFVEFQGVTFMAERSGEPGRALSRVFVHERSEDGAARTVTSAAGALFEDRAGERSQLSFRDGLLVDEAADGERAVIAFQALEWPIDSAAFGEFRPRGATERELTWPELLPALDTPPTQATREQIASEIHGRAARSLMVLIVPFLAIPLATAGGRTRSVAPLAVGIIAFLFFIQSLQFAEGMADLGRLSAPVAIWTPVLLFAAGSGWLFWRAWRGVGFDPSFDWIRLPRIRRRARAAA